MDSLDPLFWADAVDDAKRAWECTPCPRCKRVTKKRYEQTPNFMHLGKVVCAECEGYPAQIAWMKKPNSPKRRAQSSVNLAKKYGFEYCQMCLRYIDELPLGQVLHGHHVIEHQDGGLDDKENIWALCTHCHDLVTLTRRHVGHNNLRQKKEGAA